jgi:mono/diheme cytochrome c family protein
MRLVVGLTLIAVSLTGCLSEIFDEPQKLGGIWVSSKHLNLGHDTYMNYCMQCHGIEGDGKGPAAPGLNPPPRNFKTGLYKFANVGAGQLPTDDDLKHTIRYGLRGTAMLPWDISDERLDAVVQYIKTFSPVWKNEVAGTPLLLTSDPFGPERKNEAIALGRKVYHGLAQCWTCHPSYASLDEVQGYAKELTGNGPNALRPNPELPILQASSYDDHKFMPPDFTLNFIKTSGSVESTYQLLGAGVNGTSMPAWKGLLSTSGDEKESEQRQWALAYYVASLYELKYDWSARKKFFDELNERRKKDADVSTSQTGESSPSKP